MEWQKLQLLRKHYDVRIQDGAMEIRGYDLESEEIALILSSTKEERVEALCVLRALLGSTPTQESLLKALRAFEESGEYSRRYTPQFEINIRQTQSPLFLAMASNVQSGLQESKGKRLLRMIASHRNTHPMTLSAMAKEQPGLRSSIAANPNTPKKLLEEFARTGVAEIVYNPHASPEMLKTIYFHPEFGKYRREALYNHPNCPEEILHLVRNESPSLKGEFVRNTSKQEYIELMLRDESYEVRISAIANKNLSLERREQMLKDPHPDVRIAVLREDSSIEIQLILAQDQYAGVRKSLAWRSYLDTSIMDYIIQNEKDPGVLAELAHNGRLNNEQALKLAMNPSYLVRVELAKNKSLGPGLVELLLRDRNGKVRKTLLAYRNLSAKQMLFLEKDKNKEVSKKARRAQGKNLTYQYEVIKDNKGLGI